MSRSTWPLSKMLLSRAASAGALAAALWCGSSAVAQDRTTNGRYFPINANMSPGQAAAMLAQAGRTQPGVMQPVRVVLPSRGQVQVFAGPGQTPGGNAPANFALSVSNVYRLRISQMPEYPNVELFPTVELVDHLHPPRGAATRFPVPIEFTPEEIEYVLDGRFVTKVVYLEQPDLAAPREQETAAPVTQVAASQNLLAEADRLGRPIAIVRLGGRQPDLHNVEPGFFGTGGPAIPLRSVPQAAPEQQPPSKPLQ